MENTGLPILTDIFAATYVLVVRKAIHCWFLGSPKIFFPKILDGRWCPKKKIGLQNAVGRINKSLIIPVFDRFMSYYVHVRLKLISVTFYNSSITFWGIPLIFIFVRPESYMPLTIFFRSTFFSNKKNFEPFFFIAH